MKYALALEGGGTKGSYHAGAFKALNEMNVEIEAVTGTSVGSMNGACLIQEGWEYVYEFWENIQSNLIIPEEYIYLVKLLEDGHSNNHKELLKELNDIIVNKGLKLTAIKKSLYNTIIEKKVRASNINFGLVTFSLTEMKPIEIMIKDIPEGKLVEYILASAYLPGFKREKIDGKSFIDGGFYDNLPINLLIKNGYNNIIAIELLGKGRKQKVIDESSNVIYISPSDSLGRTLTFKKEISLNNLKMGYYDTKRTFENLLGQWYYLNKIWSIDKTLNFLFELSDNQINGLADMLNIKNKFTKRCLFEKIIPKIIDLISIPDDADYNIVLLYLLEYIAKKLEINRYQILNMDTLIDLIKEKLQNDYDDSIDWNESVIKLLKKVKLYDYTFKEKVLIGCAQVMITNID